MPSSLSCSATKLFTGLYLGCLFFALGCNDHAEFDGSAYLAENTSDAEAEAESVAKDPDSTAASSDAPSVPAKPADAAEVEDAKPEPSAAPPTNIGPAPTQLEATEAEIKRRSDGTVAEVHLRKTPATDAMAEEIGRFKKLVKLTINNSEMTEAGWAQLSNLGELQQFDLRGCAVNNKQLTSAIAGMPKLRALRLNGKSGLTTVDDLAMEALSKCTELKALALDHLWVGVDGLKPLQACTKLSELYLAATLVDDEALEVIAGFSALKKLRIAQTSVSGDGMQHLTKLSLEDLDASECSVLNDDSLKIVGSFRTLKRLNLFKVPLSDLGVDNLAGLTDLTWMNLDQTGLTDEGMPALKSMTKMQFLHLGSTGVSDLGLEQLTAMQSLRNLIVTRTAVTEAGVADIKQAISGVEVQLKYVESE